MNGDVPFFKSSKNLMLLVVLALMTAGLLTNSGPAQRISGDTYARTVEMLFMTWIAGKGLQYGLKDGGLKGMIGKG